MPIPASLVAPPLEDPVFPGLQGGNPAPQVPGIQPTPAGGAAPVTPIELEDNVNGWQTFLKQVGDDPALAQSLLFLGAKLTDPQGAGGFAQITASLNDANALLNKLQSDQVAGQNAAEDRQRAIASEGTANKLTEAKTDLATAQAEKARRIDPTKGPAPSDKDKLAAAMVREGMSENVDAARILIEQGVTQTKEQFVLAGLKQAEVQSALFGGLDADARAAATRSFEKAYDALSTLKEGEAILEDREPTFLEANVDFDAAEYARAQKMLPALKSREQFNQLKQDPAFLEQLTSLGIVLPPTEE